MSQNTRTTDLLLAKIQPRRLIPFKRPLHRIDRDIYGLEEFPVKVLLLWFRDIFANMDRFRWNAEQKETNIFISDKYPEKLNEDELKPAILTDRGLIVPFNFNGRQRNPEPNLKAGIIEFGDLQVCQMTVHCLAKPGLEASQIASVVYALFNIDEDALKPRGIHALTGQALGSEGEFLTDSEYTLMDVPVSVTLQFGWSWARNLDGDRFVKALVDVVDP